LCIQSVLEKLGCVYTVSVNVYTVSIKERLGCVYVVSIRERLGYVYIVSIRGMLGGA